MFKEILNKNSYFLIPFLIWMIAACLFIFSKTDKEIFFIINSRYNVFFDKLMTVLSAYGRGESVAIMFILMLLIPLYRNKVYIFTTLLFGLIVPLLVYVSKDFFSRARPIGEYNAENVHHVAWLTNLVNDSFPSGHTMGAFGLFFLLNHFLPQKNIFISIFFFILALGCGYSRIYLGQHFFTDVFAGSIIGVTLSMLILYAVNVSLRKKINV